MNSRETVQASLGSGQGVILIHYYLKITKPTLMSGAKIQVL
jgi:hypothetical protein